MANASPRRFPWLPLVLLLISLAVFWVWPFAFPGNEPTLTGSAVPSVVQATESVPEPAPEAAKSPAAAPQTP